MASRQSREQGYWKNWANVETELSQMIAELGHFPNYREAQKRNSGMISALRDYHGTTLAKVRESKGYKGVEKPKKYWQNWDNVEAELNGVIEQLEHFPNQRELSEMSGVCSAISRYHGGLNQVRLRMGYKETKKPQGYWKDFDNVERELKPIIEQIGHFPRRSELRGLGLGGLLSEAGRSYQGISEIRKRMGYRIIKRPQAFWKDFGNIESEVKRVIEKIGHFPTYDEMKQEGIGGLVGTARKYHGISLNDLRRRMGYEIVSTYTPKQKEERGFWKDFGNVKEVLRNVAQELGRFPTQGELRDRNYSGLLASLKRHGGFSRVREILGYEKVKVKRQVTDRTDWSKIDNVKSALESIIQRSGRFPTFADIRRVQGLKGLDHGIADYHGGLTKVRELMEYTGANKGRGYWQKWENVEAELNSVIKKIGHFPTQAEMASFGLSALASRIGEFYGGINNVRRKMGYEVVKKDMKYWKDLKNVENELNVVIEEIGHFPTQKDLKKMGRTSLSRAIHLHGGFSKMREQKGHKLLERPKNYWKDFDNVQREMRQIIGEIGHFPNEKEIVALGFGGLQLAISRKHGGMNSVREKLGYEVVKRDSSYWVDWNNVEEGMKKIIGDLGRFPTVAEIRKLNSGLANAIYRNHHMDIDQVRQKMGYEDTTIRTPEQFTGFLKEDATARNLVAMAASLNGDGYEIEKIIEQIYGDRFQDIREIHGLISQNKEMIEQVVKAGFTNLGTYIGEYSLEDRAIMPLLMSSALSEIPQEKMTPSLSKMLMKILKNQYGPRFNSSPKETLIDIESRVTSSTGISSQVYSELRDHYQAVMKLEEELRQNG